MRALLLASSSPRRKDLLEFLGVPFEILPSDFPEEDVEFGELDDPKDYVLTIATGKALAVADKLLAAPNQSPIILGADTAVFLDDKVYGKPRDFEDAKLILRQLSGRKHLVVTGFMLLDPLTGEQYSEAVETYVEFFKFQEEELERYIATGESIGKAGAYAIQGEAKRFVRQVEGSVSNVVGLPLEAVAGGLEHMGIPVQVDVRQIVSRHFSTDAFDN
ncbi:septum formation protein Maf [Candidatus Woesebacteria bacterium]|nr:septum formation protein Maf [Candidatus Woesebacteria bacterium]